MERESSVPGMKIGSGRGERGERGEREEKEREEGERKEREGSFSLMVREREREECLGLT